MRKAEEKFSADDKKAIHLDVYRPEKEPKAIVHIAHGMAEHARRYERFAGVLTAAGYAVYANDHRGHGKTAENSAEIGYFADSDGFVRCARDLVELIAYEKRQLPGLPLFLFGHSMGSYLAQEVAITNGAELHGLVLCGSAGKPTLLAAAGRLVARAERLRLGAHGKSALIKKLTFDAFNAQFKPNRTACDWLSRDPAEVDKYVADPLCGFECTTSLWIDVLDGLARIAEPSRQAAVPKNLPIYIMAGSEDPVSEKTKTLDQLIGAYGRAGVRDVTHRYYQDGRHEMLNETNRDEVMKDVVAWFDAHL